MDNDDGLSKLAIETLEKYQIDFNAGNKQLLTKARELFVDPEINSSLYGWFIEQCEKEGHKFSILNITANIPDQNFRYEVDTTLKRDLKISPEHFKWRYNNLLEDKEKHKRDIKAFYSKLEEKCVIKAPRTEMVIKGFNPNEILLGVEDGTFLTVSGKGKVIVHKDDQNSSSQFDIDYNPYQFFQIRDGRLKVIDNKHDVKRLSITEYDLEGRIREIKNIGDMNLDKEIAKGLPQKAKNSQGWDYDIMDDKFHNIQVICGAGVSKNGTTYIMLWEQKEYLVSLLAIKKDSYNYGTLGTNTLNDPHLAVSGEDIHLIMNDTMYKADQNFEKIERLEELSKLRPRNLIFNENGDYHNIDNIPVHDPEGQPISYIRVFDKKERFLTYFGAGNIWGNICPINKGAIYAMRFIPGESAAELFVKSIMGGTPVGKCEIHKFRWDKNGQK